MRARTHAPTHARTHARLLTYWSAAKWLLQNRALLYYVSLASLLFLGSCVYITFFLAFCGLPSTVANTKASDRARSGGSRGTPTVVGGGAWLAGASGRGVGYVLTGSVVGLLAMWHVVCWHPELDVLGEMRAARAVYAAGLLCMLLSGVWMWRSCDSGEVGSRGGGVGGEWLLVVGTVIFLVPLHNEQNLPVLAGLCLQGYCAAQVRLRSARRIGDLDVRRRVLIAIGMRNEA
jgi:hypothetical protein